MTGGMRGKTLSCSCFCTMARRKVLGKSKYRERKRGREERPRMAGEAMVMLGRGKGACLQEGSTYG